MASKRGSDRAMPDALRRVRRESGDLAMCIVKVLCAWFFVLCFLVGELFLKKGVLDKGVDDGLDSVVFMPAFL